MQKIIEVDLATHADEPELMEMCRALHKENAMFEMSEDCVRDTLRTAFDKRGGTIGVIRGEKRLEGMIYLLICRFWYSNEWHLEELLNWVRPEHRKSNNAKALINFAKKCSDELMVPLVIGVMSNIRTEAKIELYKRQINKPAGAFFFYGTKWDKMQQQEMAQLNG